MKGPSFIWSRPRRTRLSLTASGKSRPKVGNDFKSCREPSARSIRTLFRAEIPSEFALEFDSEVDVR